MTPPIDPRCPRELTVREFAEQERVTERTVYTWIQKGSIEVRRTAGGGIRICDRRTAPRAAQSIENS